MAERNRLISLDGFLKKYLAKRGIDEDEYHRYRIIVQDGLSDLSIHHMPIVKKTELTVSTTTNTASFPSDYIDYVSLSIEVDGRWWPITRDDSIVDGTLDNVTAENVGDFEYGQGFAQPGGVNKYYYTVDRENNRFIFNNVTGKTVVLRYKSTGVEVVAYGSTSDVQVPVEAEPSLEAYLRWKVADYDGEPEGRVFRLQRMYEDEVVKLRRIGEYSIEELRHIMLGTMSQTTNR